VQKVGTATRPFKQNIYKASRNIAGFCILPMRLQLWLPTSHWYDSRLHAAMTLEVEPVSWAHDSCQIRLAAGALLLALTWQVPVQATAALQALTQQQQKAGWQAALHARAAAPQQLQQLPVRLQHQMLLLHWVVLACCAASAAACAAAVPAKSSVALLPRADAAV
jgi:hypothetical protein